jgi:hypothetical protein
MLAMLLLLAASAQPGAHLSAAATAVILPGARIALAQQQVQNGAAQPQRTTLVRQDAGQSQKLRLVEFQ